MDQREFFGATDNHRLTSQEDPIMARQDIGIPDDIYDVVSVLYHALQGAETYDQYVRDAEQRGDQELARYFREVQEEEIQRALRGKELLARRLTQ
jgi:hypothetical protein